MDLLSPRDFPALSEAGCIQIQRQLSAHIVSQGSLTLPTIGSVAGVDLAYWQEGDAERAVCCIVVIDCRDRRVVEKQYATGTVHFPYIPGCLAFRELPLVLEAAAKLSAAPDLYIFDGNGILHPRRMGLAPPPPGSPSTPSGWRGQKPPSPPRPPAAIPTS